MLGECFLNILFVCTGNTCRSPMAEGILRTVAFEKGIEIKIKSAGIFADMGSPASINAISSVGDIGVDIRNHLSQAVTEEIVDESDLILTMTISHKDILMSNYPDKRYKIFSLNQYAFGKDRDIKDPYGGDRHTYDMARDEIMHAIKKIYNHI